MNATSDELDPLTTAAIPQAVAAELAAIHAEEDELPFPPLPSARSSFLSEAVRAFTADGVMEVGRIDVRGRMPVTPPEEKPVSTQTALLAVFQAMPPELQMALRSMFPPRTPASSTA
jgi:hypothetical protein